MFRVIASEKFITICNHKEFASFFYAPIDREDGNCN